MDNNNQNINTPDSNGWTPTANRFVAFFDIMGFKDLVLKRKHEDIVNILKTLSDARNELNNINNTSISPNDASRGETKSFTFSDSIIFFSKSDKEEDAYKIVLDCIYLLRIALRNKIPIKGAISYGKITVDIENSIYFGQPIIDAFLLHEDLHLFSVIADNSFEKKISELNMGKLDAIFEFYKTPLKSGKTNHYVLKPQPKDKETTLSNLKNLYLTVSGKPRQYIDNTIDFINTATYKE